MLGGQMSGKRLPIHVSLLKEVTGSLTEIHRPIFVKVEHMEQIKKAKFSLIQSFEEHPVGRHVSLHLICCDRFRVSQTAGLLHLHLSCWH